MSEDKEFENIDIFSNHDMIFQNLIEPNTIEESMENLPYVISEISVLMTDEDFMWGYDEIGYIEYHETKELNVEIDYVKICCFRKIKIWFLNSVFKKLENWN